MRSSRRFITVLHLSVLVFIYVSPFIVPLKWLLVLAGIYFLQIIVLGGCVLTKLEFGSYSDTVYWHYLNRIGLRFEEKKVRFVVGYIIPPIILFTAYIYQKFGRCLLC